MCIDERDEGIFVKGLPRRFSWPTFASRGCLILDEFSRRLDVRNGFMLRLKDTKIDSDDKEGQESRETEVGWIQGCW
jgi:hypothetical protein